ncbi:MAG: phosphomannomutase/phosphoglucomutase [Candidatus Caldipriscus sp.]|nr:phosphomannomutase/phosphoglucomutase [Candidatus Caldipriscus sp.]
MKHVFRKYDIRGIYPDEINEDFAYRLGVAFGKILESLGGSIVVVGGDVRKHTPPLKEALIRGLRHMDIKVMDIGTCPTPVMYFASKNLHVHAGIQVTASHNPKQYNGFKIVMGGEPFYGEDIEKLYHVFSDPHLSPKYPYPNGKLVKEEVLENYINWMAKSVEIDNKFNFGVDAGNGTAGPVVEKIYSKLGLKFEGIYMEPDGDFPNHLPDPTVPEYMRDLAGLVRGKKLDFGFGFDGDADRLGLVDGKGEMVFADKILAILARQILKELPGSTIIMDVKCSKGVKEYIESLGGKVYMYKTGHSLIKAKMKEMNVPLAGEMSGHIFFNYRFFGHDDAIYASLRFLEVLSKEGKSLEELLKEIPEYISTPEIRVEVLNDEVKFRIVDELVDEFKREGYPVIDIDGARIEFEDGFALVRASNTQNVLVLRFEAKSEGRLEELKEMVFKKLRRYKEINLESPAH